MNYTEVSPLKGGVAHAATHNQNSQLMKFVPEILNEFFTFIIFWQSEFTILDISLFLNYGRISS